MVVRYFHSASEPSVAGILTGITTSSPVTNFVVTANGSSAYRFAGGGVDASEDNPVLFLEKGVKYRFDNKGARALDGILSDRSFSWKDLAKKSKDNKQTAGTYRAKTKGAQITLEEYIEELGEELGKKGFELDKQRMRRLRRWIGKNVHLAHIQPISKGGFDHPANMILLYAKDNLSKNAKVLPDSFFTNMKIPKTKQELIRSSLRSQEIPNKVKREVILELLIK